MTESASTPLKYLDKALGALRNLGLIKSEPEEAPVVALIERIEHLDPEKAAAVARTLAQASLFNEVVREQISAMSIGTRYESITKSFDSIRDDAKRMVSQIEDGKIDTFERLSNIWMNVTRGDVPSRFEKIKKISGEPVGAGARNGSPNPAVGLPVGGAGTTDGAERWRCVRHEGAEVRRYDSAQGGPALRARPAGTGVGSVGPDRRPAGTSASGGLCGDRG